MNTDLTQREKRLKHQLVIVADAINYHGDIYWPVFETLDEELSRVRKRRKKLSKRFKGKSQTTKPAL